MNPITQRERRTVVADANVLYSNEQRNVLVTLSMEGALRLRWTDEIEAEWVKSLIKNNAHILPSNIERTCRLMREAIPDHDVSGYANHLQATGKTDHKDKHVAAAAIACSPSYVATWNVRDFDKETLSKAHVRVDNPDRILCEIFDVNPAVVHAAAQKAYGYVRKKDGRPSWSEYLDIMGAKNAPCSLKYFAKNYGSMFLKMIRPMMIRILT